MAINGYDGLRLAKEIDYDLILLDVMLPGVSGFDICRELRKEKNLPIIMVTAKKTDVDKIRGLGLGADDYMIKPFDSKELVARVKAVLRRYAAPAPETAKPSSDKYVEYKDLGLLIIDEEQRFGVAD